MNTNYNLYTEGDGSEYRMGVSFAERLESAASVGGAALASEVIVFGVEKPNETTDPSEQVIYGTPYTGIDYRNVTH